ncbi:hypothetical protein L1987_65586 [Smallanthus sonchifolius]|uniref:Uncharacterized protein n=1 Tax=Smallanthus sonchifolius TaxID=185202 RepID=A0ACB9BUW4_9ASTR|nr:hypothetical protein L1987_65586 [Smallanthus sonchifolius]
MYSLLAYLRQVHVNFFFSNLQMKLRAVIGQEIAGFVSIRTSQVCRIGLAHRNNRVIIWSAMAVRVFDFAGGLMEAWCWEKINSKLHCNFVFVPHIC